MIFITYCWYRLECYASLSFRKHSSEDTGHFSILVDNHEICEAPGDALRNDSLKGQASSVVHVGVWDRRGQLLTKPHRPLWECIR